MHHFFCKICTVPLLKTIQVIANVCSKRICSNGVPLFVINQETLYFDFLTQKDFLDAHAVCNLLELDSISHKISKSQKMELPHLADDMCQ